MEGSIRLYRAVPGPTVLGPLVARFCREGEGVLTAFDEAALVSLAELRPDEECEVVSFPSLVAKTLASTGEALGNLASAGHQQAAVARALADLPRDSVLGAGAAHPGLHRAVLKTLHEMHAFGIDADALDGLAGRLPGRLGEKLGEMAELDRTLGATLESLGRSTHGRHLRACLDALAEADGEDCRAFVLIGGERSPARLRWLRWAAESGWDLTVVVERHATDGTLFLGAGEAAEILGVEAQDVGSGHRLLNTLFARSEHTGPGLDLEIRSAPDPLAECEWALRGCLEAGPERCGLYVRDLPSYAPLLQAASRRLGVPVCAPQRVPLLTNAFARLTLTVLEAVAGHDVRALRPVLSSSYLDLSGRKRRAVEAGLRDAHRTGFVQWETLERWVAGGGLEWLSKILEWRIASRSAAEDLGGWLDRLRLLVHELPWHGAYGGTAYDANRDVRAFSAMQTALANEASVERALGAPALDLAGFARRCRALWETADVSVPTPDVGVPVASHAAALTGVHTLFVLGMLEGSFPRRASQDPILGDDERRAISELRAPEPPLPLSADRAAEERDEFYRVCAAATHRLVLSYPLADDSRDNVPAFYLEAAAQAAGGARRQDLSRDLLAPLEADCLAPSDRAMRDALDAPREKPMSSTLVDAAARDLVTAPAGERQAGELRDALRCGFLYATRHRLGLRPNRRENRWYRLRSLPQAAGLASQPDPDAAKAALDAALEGQLERLTSDIPEWEIPLLRAGGKRLIVDWIRREYAARKLWPSDEGSLRLDVPFGEGGIRSAMPFGLTLAGVAPAVSRFGTMKTMHLYGGPLPPVKELNAADRLYYGLHLLALFEPGVSVQLEVESTGGRRTRMRVDRGGNIARRTNEGLDMEWLVEEDDREVARRMFFDGVKASLKEALRTVEAGDMRPSPGDACDVCGFGELCRRSRLFGEEDSPFGADLRSLGGR